MSANCEKYAQCCDIVTFNADLYLLLCRENVQTFTRKIATVNDFDSSFGYRNLRIHKSAICEPLQGKRLELRRKAETGDFQYPQPYVSEFIFCDDAKLNEIEENIWIARNIRHDNGNWTNYSWSINRLLILTPAPFWARRRCAVGCLRSGGLFHR